VFNHFRTLLLNAPGPAAGGASPRYATGGIPYAEAVPVGFQPVPLPAYLKQARARLFGVNPDQAMLAYRAVQVLTAVHACELAACVTALDPRLTYELLQSGPPPAADPFQPSVQQLSGPAAVLLLAGAATAPDTAGVCGYSLTLTFDGTTAVVAGGGQSRTSTVTYSGGLAAALPLAGTGYTARVPAALGSTVFSWQITGYLRPVRDPAGLVAELDSLGDAVTVPLFGGTTPPEPYATFRNLWYGQAEGVYRLAAFACALVYRTEEVRQAGGG